MIYTDGTPTVANAGVQSPATSAADRLEYLRRQLRAECISWSELAELQGLAGEIAPNDVELLEAAGVPEHPQYVVIENTPGYPPEDDEPATFDSYDEAVAYMRERVSEYVEDIEECDATAEVSEGWASPDNYAAVMVYRSDRSHDLGRYFGVERDNG